MAVTRPLAGDGGGPEGVDKRPLGTPVVQVELRVTCSHTADCQSLAGVNVLEVFITGKLSAVYSC